MLLQGSPPPHLLLETLFEEAPDAEVVEAMVLGEIEVFPA